MARAKKLINDPLKVTVEELEGFVKAYSHIVKKLARMQLLEKMRQ